MISRLAPNWRSCEKISGAIGLLSCASTSPTSRSFQTKRTWKIPSDAIAGIPRDLLGAARIDGASELRIFARVVLPLGIPAIASLGIFQVLFVWNDLLVGLVLAQDNKPIAPEIFSQLRQFGANLEIIAPAAFFSAVIPLAIFAMFQRYFVEGLLAGSVK